MFQKLKAPRKQQDGIMAMMRAVAADQRPSKVDLTVGLYKNELGQTPLMRAVRKADQELSHSRPNKAYVLPTGSPAFMSSMKQLAFGNDHNKWFIEGVQTPGASGALSLILKLVSYANPDAKVWVSDPTYLNHLPTIKAHQLDYGVHPYLDWQSMQFRRDEFHQWLATLGKSDVVIFHGSCHNPSGLKVDTNTLHAVADAAQKQGFFPIFDTAYQGLGDGVEQDAQGLRIVSEKVERLALSISCSKSFSLYSDRVGCAFVLGANQNEVDTAQAYLASYSRPTYWVPPNNGAEIVAKVLTTPTLKQEWQEELEEIRHRVQSLRHDLTLALQEHSDSPRFDYIKNNCGMFSMLPSTPEQMQHLREQYAIYGLMDGRINIAALKEVRIDYVAKCIDEVLHPKKFGSRPESRRGTNLNVSI
ncbi:MAG: aromatic amino acid transaminase [Bdellovibrionales bacterium]|nr:aromatic amino acid transaminase [Bdellovibrionales bacterium]